MKRTTRPTAESTIALIGALTPKWVDVSHPTQSFSSMLGVQTSADGKTVVVLEIMHGVGIHGKGTVYAGSGSVQNICYN